MGLHPLLDEGKNYIADGGYRDRNGPALTPTGYHEAEDRRQSLICARHETVNCQFKQFSILQNRFHFPLEKHEAVFTAIANITQVNMELGNEAWNPNRRA